MFKSKRRAVITPQSEHLRLVGTLAMLWGNADFDAPSFDRSSLIMGLGLHDRGYGSLDNFAIGGMTDEDWNKIARRSFYMQYSDVVADTIAKYHVRRLASHDESPERQAMTIEFSQVIDKQLEQYSLAREVFDRTDRITNLCDKISFDFCMDIPRSDSVSVYPRNRVADEVVVQYHVDNGVIHVLPWPFSVTSYEGYLIAYRADGYPEELDPIILPYRLEHA